MITYTFGTFLSRIYFTFKNTVVIFIVVTSTFISSCLDMLNKKNKKYFQKVEKLT